MQVLSLASLRNPVLRRSGFPKVACQSVDVSAVDMASLVCINRKGTLTNWSEFSGGPQAGQGAGVLALWGEAEGPRLVQPGGVGRTPSYLQGVC